MKIKTLVMESIQTFRSNLLRSSLTVIGIVIGIFSVTMMLALGAGMRNDIVDSFNSFIFGDITILGEITLTDIDWINTESYIVRTLATRNFSEVEVVVNGDTYQPNVQVMLGDYREMREPQLVSGSLFDFKSSDFRESVAVVDEGFVTAVTEVSGNRITAGTSRISIGGQLYLVVGIIEGGTGFGRWGDGTILVPYRAALGTLTNTATLSSLDIDLTEPSYYSVVATHVLSALNVARGAAKDSEEYFSISSAQLAIEEMQSTNATISLFLGLIGGIALFVGGIGTMNMMLTTVTERTREIGLRKAIGARNQDVLMQILTESVLLTVAGGLIGVLLSLATSKIVNFFLTDSFISLHVSASVMVTAVCVSIVVGIIFGIYPARNAARLQPVDALRTE